MYLSSIVDTFSWSDPTIAPDENRIGLQLPSCIGRLAKFCCWLEQDKVSVQWLSVEYMLMEEY